MKCAPKGFTRSEWNEFNKQGVLTIQNAFSGKEIELLKNKIYDLEDKSNILDDSSSCMMMNIVEEDQIFCKIIDSPQFIGYIYDIYSDSTKLLLSQFFVRKKHAVNINRWHFDGPRNLPFKTFTDAPLRIKVGVWLTDISSESDGALLYIPGSHKLDHYIDEYDTLINRSDQKLLSVKAGDVTLMYSGLWHKVTTNSSNYDRVNLFYEYGPSWIKESDRFLSDISRLPSITREQKIILRIYEHPNYNIKHMDDELPIYKLDKNYYSNRGTKKLRLLRSRRRIEDLY